MALGRIHLTMLDANKAYLWHDLLLVPLAIEVLERVRTFNPPISERPKLVELLRNNLFRFNGAETWEFIAEWSDKTNPARDPLLESDTPAKIFCKTC